MYIEVVPNRSSNPTVLLREGWREGKTVHKRTLANLSKLPPEAVELLRRILRGEILLSADEELEIERSWPHGAVAAVVGTIKKLKLDQLLASRRSPDRDRVLALVAARVLAPTSRLAVSRMLDPETAASTLGQVLDVEGVSADQLYAAMDWLGARQVRIEAKLAKRHLVAGTLVLYDVTSSYFTGKSCPLAKRGYSRDKKRGTLQIVVGLLCTPEGCPIGVEVFPGNTGDPATLAAQIFKVRERWGLDRVIWVADRGLLTEARIREELRGVPGLDWISGLRSPAIKALIKEEALQLSLFDEQDLFEFTSDQFPDERLVACRNPLLAARRAKKREALLVATEQDLEKIAVAVEREKNPLPMLSAECQLACHAHLPKEPRAREPGFRAGDTRAAPPPHPDLVRLLAEESVLA
jgi:Transposase DDE domain